jgi:CheY-like chemotaxis protein
LTAFGPGVMFRIDFNKLRFLVCDDNPHMRRILRTLLHSFGAREVYEAEDGATALEMYSHYVPDIVITDWAMPIFDGLELAQMIRQPESKGNPYAPIIMLTGHSEKRRVTVARDAGVTEFLAKPISAKGLYQRILNVVANPRPFIKTKTYFGPDRRRNTNSAYMGPERRVGEKHEVLQQPSLLDKARSSI